MLSADEVDDLLYCSRAGELSELQGLLEAHLQRQSKDKGDPVALNELMRAIASANEAGNTLLHFAAANGHQAIIDFLVPLSDLATLLAQNESGNTPLHWASLNGHLEAVQVLVQRIDDLTPVADPKDYSHLTEEKRDAEEEKEARKRSVWDVVNHAGKGPMSEAQMNNREKVVDFLLQHMIAGLGRVTEQEGQEKAAEAETNGSTAQERGLESQTDKLALN